MCRSGGAARKRRAARVGVRSHPFVVFTSISRDGPSGAKLAMSSPAPSPSSSDTQRTFRAKSSRPAARSAACSIASTCSSPARPRVRLRSSRPATSNSRAICGICFSSCGGSWFDNVGGGPTQISASSRRPPTERRPGCCPSQSGLIASHRATTSTSVIWKLNAGLYPGIQSSPRPFSTALMFWGFNSTDPSERSFSSGSSARPCCMAALQYCRPASRNNQPRSGRSQHPSRARSTFRKAKREKLHFHSRFVGPEHAKSEPRRCASRGELHEYQRFLPTVIRLVGP